MVDVWPLFGASGLAPANTVQLRLALRQLREARNSNQIRDALHAIHQTVYHELNVIPLWQTVEHLCLSCQLARDRHDTGVALSERRSLAVVSRRHVQVAMKRADYRSFSCVLLQLTASAMLLCISRLPARGQEAWELSPYRVQLVVAADPITEFQTSRKDGLVRGIEQRVAVVVGGVCQLSAMAAGAPLRIAALNPGRQADLPDVAALSRDQDKVILVGIQSEAEGYHIAVREYDCTTQRWLAAQSGQTRQASQLANVAADLVLARFSPVARVSFGLEGKVLLHERGTRLAPRDPSWQRIRRGDVFQPILRQTRYDDPAKQAETRPIDWTFLVAEHLGRTKVECELITGLRNPLAVPAWQAHRTVGDCDSLRGGFNEASTPLSGGLSSSPGGLRMLRNAKHGRTASARCYQ